MLWGNKPKFYINTVFMFQNRHYGLYINKITIGIPMWKFYFSAMRAILV